MIEELETIILSAAQTVYDAWGWFGVAMLLVFENATGITPSEIILGLAGWMLIAEKQQPLSLVLLGGFYAAAGSSIGASITYWAARLGGRPLVEKIARWLRIDPAQITRVENQFHRWGLGVVLIGRVIPGIRTLISVPAGLARMPFPAFITATFIGAYAWCTLLIGAGYILGREWTLVSAYLKLALPYLLGGGVIALALYLWITRQSLSPEIIPVQHDDFPK